MDFFEVIHQRHSVREYDARKDVSDEQVQRILNAAIEAPSAGNCQPWSFIVVRDPAIRRRLVPAALGQTFLAQAPVVIAVCCEASRSARRYGQRGTQLYCLQDTAAAAEHLVLAATALGLGTCWVGAFDEVAAARLLDLPETLRPIALIPIGHPAHPSARETPRRPLRETVSYR